MLEELMMHRAGVHRWHLHQLHHDAMHAEWQVQDRDRQAHHLRAGHEPIKEAPIYYVLNFVLLTRSVNIRVVQMLWSLKPSPHLLSRRDIWKLQSTPLVIGYLARILVPAGGPAEDFLSSTGFCLTMDFLGALSTHYRATGSLGIAGIRYICICTDL